MSPIVMVALGILACVILYRVAQAMSRPGAKASVQSVFTPAPTQPPNAAGAYSALKEIVGHNAGRKVVEALSEAAAHREARQVAEDLAIFQSRSASPLPPTVPTSPP